MKLKIAKKNPDDSTSPVGKFAVITDEATDATEVVIADTCQIDSLLYVRWQGAFQLQITLGGHDSTGKFHKDPKFENGLFSINKERPQDKPIWDELALDDAEGFDWKTLKRMIHDKGVLVIMAANIWKIGAVESAIEESSK